MKQKPRLLSRNSSSNYLVFARQLSRRFNFCHRRFQAPAPRRLPRVYRSYFSLGRPGLGGVTAAAALLRSDVHKHRRKTRSLPDKTAMAAGADGHRRDRPFPAAGSSPPLRQRSRGHPTPVLGVRRLLPPAPPQPGARRRGPRGDPGPPPHEVPSPPRVRAGPAHRRKGPRPLSAGCPAPLSDSTQPHDTRPRPSSGHAPAGSLSSGRAGPAPPRPRAPPVLRGGPGPGIGDRRHWRTADWGDRGPKIGDRGRRRGGEGRASARRLPHRRAALRLPAGVIAPRHGVTSESGARGGARPTRGRSGRGLRGPAVSW